jgi:hypothetical protein
MKLLTLITILALTSGCVVARAPVKAYHFAYCNQINPDGVHCERWATPCGRLECEQ